MAKGRRSKSSKRAKRTLRRAYAAIGTLRAEDDNRLEEYYIDHGDFVAKALDINDPAMVFRGQKGVGKSAILKMAEMRLRGSTSRTISITPDDLAFTALANVSSSTPLMDSAKNNQWLFKTLWQYTFAVSLLVIEHKRPMNIIERIGSYFKPEEIRNVNRLLSLSLNDDGSSRGHFTDNILRLIKEIQVQSNKTGISAQLGGQTGNNQANLPLLALINNVANSLPKLLSYNYYILIDDLDLHWTNDPVQNSFIAALFSAMSKLSKSDRVRFVVAIRDDIYRNLPIEDKDKSRDWVCDVSWDRPSLREMIETRVRVLHGISRKELWDDLLPTNAFDLMLAHSFGRPRELIRQLQIAIEIAARAGHEAVLPEDLQACFRQCSSEKLEELEQELEHTYPGLRWIAMHFSGKNREFDLSTIRDIAELIRLEVEDNPKENHRAGWAAVYDKDPIGFAWCLIDAGFLIAKTNRTAPPHETIASEYILRELPGPWFAIRPIYCPALAIKGY